MTELACSYCRTAVPAGEPFCPACRLSMQVPVHPEIAPGSVLYELDLRRAPPPRHPARSHQLSPRIKFEPDERGVLFTLHEPRTPTFPNPDVQARDACVRARFTVLDPGARVGVVARRSGVGEGRVGYAVDVSPDRREVWLKRVFESNAHADSHTVGIRRDLPEIPTAGTFDVELRVLGPTIRVLVDDKPVLTLHDPVYGAGAFGFRVGRETPASDAPVRVVCHGFDVREVAR